MVRLVFADGRAFAGRTYEDVVEALRDAALIRPPTRRRYMKEVRQRVRIWNGQVVACSSEREFCLALARLGLAALEGEEEVG